MLSKVCKTVSKSICFKNQFSNFSLKMDSEIMLNHVKRCIPPLDGSSHKGQAGRIGIVGGSLEYTGAPYFAGISALRVGADLVHVFCTTSAAPVIKSYSPELIVHPLLDRANAVTEISPWLDRLHAVVIGPGLGREPNTFTVVSDLIKTIQGKNIPMVVDADGLFLITEKPDLIKGFRVPVVLTPNKAEFERLHNKVNGLSGLQQLGDKVIIFKKGKIDEVFSLDINIEWKSNTGGSGRRCGGQGDLLSGAIATFLQWMVANADKLESKNDKALLAASVSCYAASRLIRLCNEKAFDVKARSMLAGDMIEYIHSSFEELFGQ